MKLTIDEIYESIDSHYNTLENQYLDAKAKSYNAKVIGDTATHERFKALKEEVGRMMDRAWSIRQKISTGEVDN